mmetsp:Transcript_735/g.675  ORF Transcript_735/g.675 Transcript_735/m.675 type:complete len:131 (-) Transcript_735:35-427(-)
MCLTFSASFSLSSGRIVTIALRVFNKPFISESMEPLNSKEFKFTPGLLSAINLDEYCIRYVLHLSCKGLIGKKSTIEDRVRSSPASWLRDVRMSSCLCRNVETVLDINVAKSMATDGTTIPLIAGAIILA